jgi:hypothetical protein
MVFSSTSDKNGIVQRFEFALGLPDGAVTGDTTLFKYVTSLVNEAYEEVVSSIWKVQTDWDVDDYNNTTLPEATKALTTARHILLDDPASPTINLLQVKRVDITYDGTTWYKANPVDSGEFPFGLGNDDTVDTYFNAEEPSYDVKGNLMAVYPRASADQVSAGAKVRVEFGRAFDLFTTADTTQSPGIDRPFHHLIPLGAAVKYAIYKGMTNARNLKTVYDDGVKEMQTYYMDKQLDDQKQFRPLVDSTYYS